MAALEPARLAQARNYSYRLLGRLFLDGLTAEVWPTVQAIPELAAALPIPFSPDDAAAAHHTLFAFNLFPYQAIFLDESGLLGGDVTQAVAASYQQAGYKSDAAAPDHLGQELLFLAYLSEGEAAAWETDQIPLARQWQQQQAYFLVTHLLRWLVPCVIALEQIAPPFYRQLAHLTLALVSEHYERVAAAPPSSPLLPSLPETPPTTDRARLHRLITPVHSGLYLSRANIEQLARQVGVPRGFGRREEMLRTVWDAAAQADRLPMLLASVTNLVSQWQQQYRELLDEWPLLLPFVHPWQSRSQQTLAWRQEILPTTD